MAQQKAGSTDNAARALNANGTRMSPVCTDFTWIFDQNVILTTVNGEKIEGTIFTYDTIANMVVIQQPPTGSFSATGLPYQQFSKKANFRMLRTGQITGIAYVSSLPQIPSSSSNSPANNTTTDFSNVKPPVSPISVQRVQQRLQQGVRDAQVTLSRLGKGVTAEAQAIFDALSKTLPCRWNDKSIIVMDEVIIHPPYTVDSCKAPSSTPQNAVARVKKVLEGERARLAPKTSAKPGATRAPESIQASS